jgi:DNA-binding NarL/FixJ family response regulator
MAALAWRTFVLASAALSEGTNPLTERERAVLAAPGASIAAIAAQLYLSEGTVHNYLSIAIHKRNARNRVEAARIADEKGWLQAGSRCAASPQGAPTRGGKDPWASASTRSA